jgi:hypothetical protein
MMRTKAKLINTNIDYSEYSIEYLVSYKVVIEERDLSFPF